MATEKEKFAPYQIGQPRRANIPWAVHMAAYEVYCHIFREQEAMVDLEGRNCRGGFGDKELIGFLYARTFPKAEWDARFHEAIKGDN